MKARGAYRLVLVLAILVALGGLALAIVLPWQLAQNRPAPPDATLASFSVGVPSAHPGGASGCGGNAGVLSTVRVSPANHVFLGALRASDAGGDGWIGAEQGGGEKADACAMRWAGQPVGPAPSSAGWDSAWAPKKNAAGTYTLYVAGGSSAGAVVARSTDTGGTFAVAGLGRPLGPQARPWIASHAAATSLVSFDEQAASRVTVMRSDDGGATYSMVGSMLAATDRRTTNHRLGNLVIDNRGATGSGAGDFWAFQALLAPLGPGDREVDHPYLSVSRDGGKSWSLHSVNCDTSRRNLGRQTPSVSVAPDGAVWYAWSDGGAVLTAVSHDRGSSWRCSGPVSSGFLKASLPVLIATSAGVDLVFYGSAGRDDWSICFAQNPTSKPAAWLGPEELAGVHQGSVDLLGRPAIDVDQQGWLHLTYPQDATERDAGMEVSYAVQTGGTAAGTPN